MKRTFVAVAIGAAVVAASAGPLKKRFMGGQALAERTAPAMASQPAVAARQTTAEASPDAYVKPGFVPPGFGAEVGDVDSFGRPVRFLGLMSAGTTVVSPDCTAHTSRCFTLLEDGMASFTVTDAAMQVIPAGRMESMLCHLASPSVFANFDNTTGPDGRQVYFEVIPRITFENPALNLPHRVHAGTGAPLAGSITVAMPRTRVAAVLDTGSRLEDQANFTRMCTESYLSRTVLANSYGMSEAEITAFFANPTTLRLRLTIIGEGLRESWVHYAIRWVGA